MATRLNKDTREQLICFALKTAEIKKSIIDRHSKACKAADKAVAAGLRKKYPTKDMRILEKYKCTAKDFCVRVVTEENTSQIVMYNFCKRELCPPTPQPAGCQFSRGALWLGQEAAAAVIEYEAATREFDKAKRTLKSDFSALVHKAKTFEELVKQWPPFQQASDIFNNGALTVMNDEVLNRISGYSTAKKKAA